MRKPLLIIGVLSAFVMALIFNLIEKRTGVRIEVLLYASVVMIIAGLYGGLTTNRNESKEEL